jgi:beta-lactamase class A
MLRSIPLFATALWSIATAQAPGAIDQKVRAAIGQFPGKVYLFAKNLDTGQSYALNADERVSTASTIKLPIMAAVFAAVEAGKAKWSEELTLTQDERVSGSGILGEISNGVRLPIRDVVHLMIVVSDNTATNMIIQRFTADMVNAEMDKLGLPKTRSLRKVRGDGNDLKPPSGFSAAGRLPENQNYGIGVSTPHEMVTLLEKIDRGEVVSPAASKEMIEILKRQQYREGIARHMGEIPVASKSGALDHLRSDVGIVYSPRGKIAIAVTCDDIPKIDYNVDNEGALLISRLSDILVDSLAK